MIKKTRVRMPKLSQNVVTVIDFYPFTLTSCFKSLEKIFNSPFSTNSVAAFSARSFALFISDEFESDGALGFDFFFQFL